MPVFKAVDDDVDGMPLFLSKGCRRFKGDRHRHGQV